MKTCMKNCQSFIFMQSRNLCNLEIALRLLRIKKLCANLEIVHKIMNLEIARHQWAISRSRNFRWESRLLFKYPLFIKVRNVRKLLQLHHHYQRQACTQVPHARDFRKFANSKKLPSPQSGYRCRETPNLWSAPIQGFPILESSQLSSVSQLRCSHPVSLWHCKLRLRNFKIVQTYCAISGLAAQSQDWHAVSGVLEYRAQSRGGANS